MNVTCVCRSVSTGPNVTLKPTPKPSLVGGDRVVEGGGFGGTGASIRARWRETNART